MIQGSLRTPHLLGVNAMLVGASIADFSARWRTSLPFFTNFLGPFSVTMRMTRVAGRRLVFLIAFLTCDDGHLGNLVARLGLGIDLDTEAFLI